MKNFLIVTLIMSLLIAACQQSNLQKNCKQDSECVSISEVACYKECEPNEDPECSYVSLCESYKVFSQTKNPACEKAVFCKKPQQIKCIKGQCTSIECESDSDCKSITELGCVLPCENEKKSCILCPSVNVNTRNATCEELWSICREPSKIVCESYRCKSIV